MGSTKGVNRLGMFDLLKGFGMCVIVITHIVGYYRIKFIGATLFFPLWYIGYGLMPMFFLMSGYNFRRKTFKKCVKQQAGFYIAPYIKLAIVTVPVYCVLHYLTFRYKAGAIYETKNMAMCFLFGMSGPTTFAGYTFNYGVVAVWFFLAMFIGWVLLNQIMSIKNPKAAGVVVAAVSVAGVLLGQFCDKIPYCGEIVPWCIPQGMVATGFIYLGHLMKKKSWLSRKIPISIIIAMFVFSAVCSVFGNLGMTNARWNNGIIDVVASGIAGFLCIKAGISLNKYSGKAAMFLRKVGKYNYWIISLHCFEIMAFHWTEFALKMMDKGLGFVAFIIQLVICVLVIVGGIMLFEFINKIKVKRKIKNKI